MRKKFIYLPIMTALSMSLSACIDNGGGSNAGGGANNSLSSALGSGGCGVFNSAKSIEIDDVQTLVKGASRGLSAYVVCSNGKKLDITADVSTNWSSSNYNVFEIDNKNYKGKITGVGIGKAELKVVHDGLSATKPVSVVNSYCGTSAQMMGTHVEPEKLDSIPVGGEAELHLYADCTNDTHADITNYATWQSSSKLTVDVNDEGHKGLITGKGKGSANISATLDGEKVYDHKITVDSALLKSLDVSGNSTIAAGLNSQLSVMGTYADGETVNVTKIAKYSVVYGDVKVDETGLISTEKEGDFRIQVALNGKFAYLEGHVTGAKLLKIVLNNPNIAFTPYINTSASITAKAFNSKGESQTITTDQLQCEMEGNQTQIIQNHTDGCTFSQLGETNSSVKVNVHYLGDLSIPIEQASVSVSSAPIENIQLKAKQGAFIVGNRTPYSVNLILADKKTVDITKNIQLKLTTNNGIEQSFEPTTTPLLFDSNAGEVIFSKPITSITPYTLTARVGEKESSITYGDVFTDEISKEALNNKLVSAFKNEIIRQMQAGDWYAVTYKDGKAESNVEITKFLTGLAAGSQFAINDLSENEYKKVSNIYNKAIDYDDGDSEYQITARLERNPSNRDSQVILSEFCNNTSIVQPFTSASLTTQTTEGYSWGVGEKVGVNIVQKGGVKVSGFEFGLDVSRTFEFTKDEHWNKQEMSQISLGSVTAQVPPHKHAVVVSTIHNTDHYYDGKLPLKISGGFPVLFRIRDSINHISAIGVVDLAKIYVPNRDAYLDRFFELSNHKLYLDLSPQLTSTGGKNNKTITHSIYFVDDNKDGKLPCIDLPLAQGANKASKLYKADKVQALSHQHGFEFLNRKPDLITTQH